MNNWEERQQALLEALNTRIVVLDGAMGTMLQRANLTAADFGGSALEGCNENLVRTRPDVVLDVHRAYYEAGADMVETNSFGGTPLVLAEYGLSGDAPLLNRRAAELAREAAAEYSQPGRPRFVAGSVGPDNQVHYRHRRRYVPGPDAPFLRSGKGAHRRRGRRVARRNLPGYAQHQGRSARRGPPRTGLGPAHSRHGLRHHRADGQYARGPDRRGALCFGRARPICSPSVSTAPLAPSS